MPRKRGVNQDSKTQRWTVSTPLSGAEPSGETQLVVVEGVNRGLVFDIKEGEVRIGRKDDNHLVLDSKHVSKSHARVFLASGRYHIEDLASFNGTVVNRTRLDPGEPQLLCHGDTIRIGDELLVFREAGTFWNGDGMSTINFDADAVRREADDLLRDLPPKGDS